MAGVEWGMMLFAVPFYFFSTSVLALTHTYGPMKRL